MRLKSVELAGFKSFPDKTRLTFDKPVTVIVGPNGSGKSNIADAILWVTGEQSAKAMRGGRMEDVIFGGTTRRAATGFAEVSLTLENEDGIVALENTEIVITRRYYRSGESEYYINRKTSRLRDISELLMDTGLGREGYGVIGQGRIAEILAARSRDRRDVFEEAVGISRYRHRKEEAERRLEQTDENLMRLSDKIAELSLQLDPLREQAEVARRYLLLRDELRELEIAMWAKRLTELSEQLVKTDVDIGAVTAQQRASAAETDRVYRDIETADEQRRKYDTEQDVLRAQSSEIERKASETAQTRAMQKARLENNEANIASIREDVQRRAESESGLETQIRERETRAEELQNESAELESSLKNAENELSGMLTRAAEDEREHALLLDRQREASYELAVQRARLGGLGVSAQELSDRETEEASSLIQFADETGQAADAVTAAESSLKERQTLREEQQNKLRGFEIRMQSRKNKLTEADEKLRRVTNELDAARVRARTLEQMEREYEGYARPVRAVMTESARGTLRGIHGAVGELMRVDERYALAVETALGAAVGNVVVASEEDGKAAINLLRRRDTGRATFLPLTTIRGNVLRERGLDGESGYIGIASELIEFDAQYENIFNSLLGRTAIVGTLDDAIAISRRYGARFRLVTLDGQVVNAGGAMTGGSNAQGTGILSRAGELTRLRATVAELTDTLKSAESARSDAAREAAAAEFETETARTDLRDFDDAVMRAANELEAAQRLLSERENAAETRRSSLETLRERIKETERAIDTSRAEIAALEEREAAVAAEITARGQLRTESTAERERVQNEAARLREKLAAIAAERDTTLSAVGQLREIRLGIISAAEEQIGSAEALEAQNESLRAEIESLTRSETALREEIDSLKSRENTITEEKLSLEARRTALDKLAREKSREATDLERERGRLEQRKTALEAEEKQTVDRMWDAYEVTRSDAMSRKNEVRDEPSARRRTAELRREMSELGTPNLGAIEEFERINERYTFLTSERDDVEKAAQELRAIIADITAQMREIFVAGFAEIEESFKIVFTELFGGGEASLTLDEPDDPLSSGIEIAAQPPGKKVHSLSLLSGGERAFVAIALYFALLRVKPAPFIVLDEIETALDETNVSRFARYLRRMSANTQMIVISHRRGTMEEADMLIGVTMAERGVSRLITLSLEEAENAVKENADGSVRQD